MPCALFSPNPCFSIRSSNVRVGLFYYPWYSGGNGTGHWNGIKKWTVVDTPVLGHYDSGNESIIRQHILWFEELGIDFLIISWWGIHNVDIDRAVDAVFRTVSADAPWLNLTIMVEPFNEAGGPEGYNFTEVFNYVYDAYYARYEQIWMKLDSKPLLCWFNGYNMTGGTNPQGFPSGGDFNRMKIQSDARFESRILGHNPYVDWYFITPCSVDNSPEPVLSKDGFISIEPRYDDQFLGREKNSTFDETYKEGLYDQQWSKAVSLTREGRVKLIAIYSWNEYHERSQVEPHYNTDKSCALSPFCKTARYILQVKNAEKEPPYLLLICTAIGVATGVVLTWAWCTHKPRSGTKLKNQSAGQPSAHNKDSITFSFLRYCCSSKSMIRRFISSLYGRVCWFSNHSRKPCRTSSTASSPLSA